MSEQFSFKDFENVFIKSTYDIETPGRTIREGEVLARFDKIQIAGLNEVKDYVAARGGFDNRAHVFWETTRELNLTFSQGVFSKSQFSLMYNSKMLIEEDAAPVQISAYEEVESDENRHAKLKQVPSGDLFVYDKETGQPIYYYINEDTITAQRPYQELIVTYTYNYTNGSKVCRIGKRLLNGFVSLEGRTRVKDDETGKIVTGIIKIPRLKLMSDLSMKLGSQASPLVGVFKGVGMPVGSRTDAYVSEIYFLSDDIESDL